MTASEPTRSTEGESIDTELFSTIATAADAEFRHDVDGGGFTHTDLTVKIVCVEPHPGEDDLILAFETNGGQFNIALDDDRALELVDALTVAVDGVTDVN